MIIRYVLITYVSNIVTYMILSYIPIVFHIIRKGTTILFITYKYQMTNKINLNLK